MKKPCTIQYWVRYSISALRMGILVHAKKFIEQLLVGKQC